MKGDYGIHEQLKHTIYCNPERIGIPSKYLIAKSMEAGLYLGNTLIVTPDVRYDFRNGRAYTYFIEVKSSDSQCCRNKGKEQVAKMIDWSHTMGINTKIILAYPKGRRPRLKNLLEELVLQEYTGYWKKE